MVSSYTFSRLARLLKGNLYRPLVVLTNEWEWEICWFSLSKLQNRKQLTKMDCSSYLIDGIIATIFNLCLIVVCLIFLWWLTCYSKIDSNISPDLDQSDKIDTDERLSNLQNLDLERGMWVWQCFGVSSVTPTVGIDFLLYSNLFWKWFREINPILKSLWKIWAGKDKTAASIVAYC